MTISELTITHPTRTLSANQQNLMPGRYSLTVQLLSMAAFSLAFIGWLNETWLFWFDNPIWLNRYTEYGIILGFGIWRIIAEKNPYTRRRLTILVFMVTVFWWLIPWLYPFYEPYIGFLWAQPVFPSLHVPGTISFFLILAVVFLFGRRVICGFNCPCVGIRETVGFPFRNKTLRSKWTWHLRHSKWLFFGYYVGIMVVTQFPPNSWTVSFVGGFYALVAITYFGSFFMAPLVGNRFYCRYLCPYGATFGLLNHAGFYGIKMDQDKCNDCQRCEQVCDMGIPVWQQGQKAGQVTALEDCMGCARCVVSCPTDALAIQDVRNLFKRSMVQNASYLLKQNPANTTTIKRHAPIHRTPSERIQDWSEITPPTQLKSIQQQASRCLDCGVPGCMNACPLHNNIPQWLEAVAQGNISQAAQIAHNTNNFPEICASVCPQHRLCEGACTKAKESDGAITIGAIERFLTENAYPQITNSPSSLNNPIEKNLHKKHIAIIGAGPAGLACADELNKAGFQVSIYERNSNIGGLLATGIPSFKLDKQFLTKRYQLLARSGIQFQFNFTVTNSNIRQIVTNYDAIFLGTGAQKSRSLDLIGQDLEGVTNAIDYLAYINHSYNTENSDSLNHSASNTLGLDASNKQVIVIGGGDSAMDCARAAIRQKAKQVTVIYRGKQAILRASPKEFEAAKQEGVKFLFELTPHAIQGDNRINSLVLNTPTKAQQSMVCQQLIFALGQIPQLPKWAKTLKLQTNKNGTIRIDHQGRTSNPLIYAGGDNTNGPDLVVTAIAAGRQAAQGIIHDFRITGRLNRLLKKDRKHYQQQAIA